MKKTYLMIVAALLLAVGAYAQDDKVKLEFDEDADLSFGNGVFSFEPVSYLAWGDFVPFGGEDGLNPSDRRNEFTVNILEFRIRPYATGQFAIGIDYNRDMFRIKGDRLWCPDKANGSVSVASASDFGLKSVKKSKLIVNSFSCPVSFGQEFGKVSLRVGASAVYNLSGKTKFKGVDSSGNTIKPKKDHALVADNIKTNPFTYNFFAVVDYGGVGVYAKYSPSALFQDGYGPQFKFFTLGVICGLGM